MDVSGHFIDKYQFIEFIPIKILASDYTQNYQVIKTWIQDNYNDSDGVQGNWY